MVEFIEITADAFLLESARLVAVIAMTCCTTEGAVKSPLLEIWPALADQATAVLEVP